MAWNYKREESSFKPIPVGGHRIRVKSAEKAVSKTGKDMLTLVFDVSGYNAKLYHYIVFLPDKPEITNSNLTQFFDAFPGIGDGNFNIASWVGQVGACFVKHEEYNGSTSAKIQYFLKPDKAASLSPWKEPEKKDSQTAGMPTDADGFMQVSDDSDCPFC